VVTDVLEGTDIIYRIANKEAAGSSETSAATYNSIWVYTPEDHNLNYYRREN
jgi:hypothetical protein